MSGAYTVVLTLLLLATLMSHNVFSDWYADYTDNKNDVRDRAAWKRTMLRRKHNRAVQGSEE